MSSIHRRRIDGKSDILIKNGRIAEIGKISEKAAKGNVLKATGKHVFPGLIDARVFRR